MKIEIDYNGALFVCRIEAMDGHARGQVRGILNIKPPRGIRCGCSSIFYQELKDYMEKLEQLRRNTEKAYQSALKAMFELVDAITEERNYYRDLCTEKKED